MKIIYEDNDIIVGVKEAGLPVQTKKIGQTDMVSLLRNYRNEKKEDTYVGLVHRLDQPVEGIMVFGKNQRVTAHLERQLLRGEIGKYYLAVTVGTMEKKEGTYKDYLLKNGRTNTSSVVAKEKKGSKEARLSYYLLDRKENLNLVQIHLDTGRHHQIRVQMAHHGTPLLGDGKYSDCQEVRAEKGLGLCAYRLEFQHPVTNKEMKFVETPSTAIFHKFEIDELIQIVR